MPVEGELDNTLPGKVTGWMRFAGVRGKVTFDLAGDFHRDIRGTVIRFRGDAEFSPDDAVSYMDGFAPWQTGKVGDMTAGLSPRDYVGYPYLEWYGDANGRVVLELEPNQMEVVGTPIYSSESEPVSRREQQQNLMDFMQPFATELA